MKPAASLALALCIAASATGQTPQFTDPANLRGERISPHTGRELPIDQGARGLEQLLRKLNTRASILNIVAHPDDEDGGMMAFCSRGMGARVADLSLTRGEGGQNAMTGDFEDALGLLRTQELLSSDRYPGVDQFFGTEVDFGFSKTKEESFAKWTHERVLYDAVRAIRLYRPLVLTSTWIGGVTDGHGQHQVSGEIAQEAFRAAGDPRVFPDMIAEGILPWQPLKIYARVPMQSISEKGLFDYATGKYTPARFTNYVTGEVTTNTPSVDVIVHEGNIDPLLSGPGEEPRSYVQFARIGLGLQKSQITGGMRIPTSGDVFDVSYHRYGSQLDISHQKEQEDTFFDGIDTSVESIASFIPNRPNLKEPLAKISALLGQAAKLYDPVAPQAIAPVLADALKQTDALTQYVSSSNEFPQKDSFNFLHELRVKHVQLNDALALALGLSLRAELHVPPVTDAPVTQTPPGSPLSEDLLPGQRVLIIATLNRPDGSPVQEVDASTGFTGRAIGCAPCTDKPDSPLVRPTTRYDVISLPADAAPTRPYFNRSNIEQPVYELADSQLRNAPQTPAPLLHTRTFTYNGASFQLSSIVNGKLPDDSTNLADQSAVVVPPASIATLSHAQAMPRQQNSILVALTVRPPGMPVEAEVPVNWKVTPGIEFGPAGQKQLRLTAPPEGRRVFTLKTIALGPNGLALREGFQSIGYGDLPRTNYFTPATTRIVPVDLNLPEHRRIGYLAGTGDAIPDAMNSIGLKLEPLTVADLTAARLQNFDTVILGVRTYAAHKDLHGAATQVLLDYARNGGNVVVQYQTAEFTEDDAPFPLTLGRDAEKVVDETAAVQLLDQKSPLLSFPNKLTAADFNGWVEERGHGFLRTWDNRYTVLTETHDPGQDPQRGGLVTASLGKGRWTYCAYALYRQLPEAVPGAYRFFVNLLNP